MDKVRRIAPWEEPFHHFSAETLQLLKRWYHIIWTILYHVFLPPHQCNSIAVAIHISLLWHTFTFCHNLGASPWLAQPMFFFSQFGGQAHDWCSPCICMCLVHVWPMFGFAHVNVWPKYMYEICPCTRMDLFAHVWDWPMYVCRICLCMDLPM